MKGTNYVRDTNEADEDREWKKEQRARQRKKDAEDDALQADLKTAARPIAAEQGANGYVKPPEMDNRDVGLEENAALPNAGLQQGGYSVAGKAYADQAAADAAVATANAPEAVSARLANTYRAHGNVEKAMAVESADRQAETQKLQLADMRWKRDLGAAMRGGHEGLAKLATSSDAGPMKGMNVQAIVSPDGKTVQYATVDKDGNVAPIPGLQPFTNDQDGMVKAAWMLDKTIDPAARMAHLDQQNERDRQQKNTDRLFDQSESHFSQNMALQKGAADRQNGLADSQIATSEFALQEAQRAAKIPPGVKMAVESLRDESKTINAAIVKAQADGTWDANSPNAKALLQRQAIVNAKVGQHLAPYLKDETTADPAGLRKQKGEGGGAGRGTTPNSYKDPVWEGAEQEASRKTGVPTEVMRIIRTIGERSNGDQVSPAGAKGVYQFTDASRNLFLKKYGVDAYSKDPNEQALAMAYHLKESFERTGSWDKAMAGYNGGPSAEKGTNKTAENKAYAERTSAALAAADPMESLYRKQVAEMNRGTRLDLSADVREWKGRTDTAKAKTEEQRFNAAQAAFLQSEKLREQRKSKELAAASGARAS
ncbi:transglycosylase SLT domain-containing protein [Variovorax sp. dw_954]|uniref:transglycosylase SLT domain-containing protein n=1 Tax=Variovorax sp. dw_954 TaxID=2720078 RepID=UPI001BD5ED46|nr:transglycosylase SLT domain-containing protein [Variovorax sp. dw_954]